jgi:hypothetical protein
MPMQIMACKKPIVTYDMYEIVKTPRDGLLELTMKLFEDTNFKKENIVKNYEYIMNYHTESAIAKIHLDNLAVFMQKNINTTI